MKTRIAYKLMRLRKDGTLGSLFFKAEDRVPMGKWIWCDKTQIKKGYKTRPGWHTVPRPYAPHLSERGRVWVRVEIAYYEEFKKPECQGGVWYLAKRMKIIEKL